MVGTLGLGERRSFPVALDDSANAFQQGRRRDAGLGNHVHGVVDRGVP